MTPVSPSTLPLQQLLANNFQYYTFTSDFFLRNSCSGCRLRISPYRSQRFSNAACLSLFSKILLSFLSIVTSSSLPPHPLRQQVCCCYLFKEFFNLFTLHLHLCHPSPSHCHLFSVLSNTISGMNLFNTLQPEHC